MSGPQVLTNAATISHSALFAKLSQTFPSTGRLQVCTDMFSAQLSVQFLMVWVFFIQSSSPPSVNRMQNSMSIHLQPEMPCSLYMLLSNS